MFRPRSEQIRWLTPSVVTVVISIDPGLKITIPNYELIKPYVSINSAGQEYIVNGSDVRLTAFSSFDDEQVHVQGALGRPFFNSAYMMVENDQRQITLWLASSNESLDLRAVGPAKCVSSNAPSPTARTSDSAAASQISASGLSKGAISGVFVSVAVIIFARFSVGYFFARRQSKLQNDAEKDDTGKRSSLDSDPPLHFKPELPSDREPPQETPQGKIAGDTISPYEMTGQGVALEMSAEQEHAIEMPSNYLDFATAMESPSSLRSSRTSKGPMKELLGTLVDEEMPILPPPPRASPKKAPLVSSLPLIPRMPPSTLPVVPTRKPLPSQLLLGKVGNGEDRVSL